MSYSVLPGMGITSLLIHGRWKVVTVKPHISKIRELPNQCKFETSRIAGNMRADVYVFHLPQRIV